jgi:pimeloyl-ACP methyl ester carboxylesterase
VQSRRLDVTRAGRVSQTDFTEDLKKISVPVLVMHGDDDQIVP